MNGKNDNTTPTPKKRGRPPRRLRNIYDTANTPDAPVTVNNFIDTAAPVTVYANDIDLYLRQFCAEQGIDDMTTASQSTWSACMMYIRYHVFPNKQMLKMPTNKGLQGYTNNSSDNPSLQNLNKSSCGAYDLQKLNDIADYYIYMCNLYNKGITISNFCKLTGVSEDAIKRWQNRDFSSDFNRSALTLWQKLTNAYEESIENKLWANKNPVAHLAIANRRFGWNLPGVSRDKPDQPQPLSAADLPQLDGAAAESARLPQKTDD